jgi:uncharacterized membrane protein
MRYLRILLRVEVHAAAALSMCAAGVAIWFMSVALGGETGTFRLWETGWNAFASTFVVGLLPVVLFGAPVYALLEANGRTSWPAAVLLGLAPGVALWFFERTLGAWFIGCGIGVACLTHLLAARDRLSRKP